MPVKINGATNGSVTLAAPATGSDVTLTLPAATGTVATTAYVDTAEADAIAAGGLVHIATTSASAVSSVSINNVFTSSYQNYLIVTNLKADSAYANDILLRFRASGTDDSSGNYQRQKLEVYATTAGVSRQQNQNQSTIGYLTSDTEYQVQAIIGNPQLAKPTSLYHYGTNSDGNANVANQVIFFAGNTLNTSTAYDGFTIFSVGAVNFTGTVRVYGYKNS